MKINELRAEIVRNGLMVESFADKAGFNRTTFWRRLNSPENFTLGEIVKISEALNLSEDRVLDIFFSKEVS